jgi:hypothetical protein
VAAITLQFYLIAKGYLQRKEDIKDLLALVDDSVLWFQNMGSALLRLPETNICEMENHVKELVHAIRRSSAALKAWERQYFLTTILFLQSDARKVASMAATIREARNGISFHSVQFLYIDLMNHERVLNDLKTPELRAAFPSAEFSFESEINIHLDRFVKGSRSWMSAVSSIDLFDLIFLSASL